MMHSSHYTILMQTDKDIFNPINIFSFNAEQIMYDVFLYSNIWSNKMQMFLLCGIFLLLNLDFLYKIWEYFDFYTSWLTCFWITIRDVFFSMISVLFCWLYAFCYNEQISPISTWDYLWRVNTKYTNLRMFHIFSCNSFNL